MATHGICKVTNGWVHQDSVWVQYEDGERLEIPASQYREENYRPPIEALPECSGQHMPRGPKGEKRSAPPAACLFAPYGSRVSHQFPMSRKPESSPAVMQVALRAAKLDLAVATDPRLLVRSHRQCLIGSLVQITGSGTTVGVLRGGKLDT